MKRGFLSLSRFPVQFRQTLENLKFSLLLLVEVQSVLNLCADCISLTCTDPQLEMTSVTITFDSRKESGAAGATGTSARAGSAPRAGADPVLPSYSAKRLRAMMNAGKTNKEVSSDSSTRGYALV